METHHDLLPNTVQLHQSHQLFGHPLAVWLAPPDQTERNRAEQNL